MKFRAMLLAGLVWGLPSIAVGATPKASSELRDADGSRHTAAMAFDGRLSTAWAEGEDGDGDGSWIELRLDRTAEVESISFWPGKLSAGVRSLREYGRPHTVTVSLTAPDGTVIEEQVRVLDPAIEGPLRVDANLKGRASKVRLTMDKTYSGGIYNQMYIAEVAVNFTRGPQPDAVAKTHAWLESDAGKAAVEREKKVIVALYDNIKAAEFGDRNSLLQIMERAADGSDYMRRRASQNVPMGYRVSAIPPEPTAIEALLKIKDANAIPALEQAMLRSVGKAKRKLESQVNYFYAYQDLIGGGSLNIPAWGQSGWETGSLQAFGEPLGMQLDGFGGIYVADIGNNRVQRFNFQGISDATWGGSEPEITEKWFGGSRPWYVSGGAAADTPGRFISPVDMAVYPGKFEDIILTLDALGRVHRLDSEGGASLIAAVAAEGTIGAGVGGEGFIEAYKNKFAVVYGNECFIYSLEGEELGQFAIEDGVPTGSVDLPGNKIGLIFGGELIMYSLDGFRHGTLLGDTVPAGFESWDVSRDADGKLWALTDHGWAIKYKKPGKVDYSVQYISRSVDVPRFDVYDDILFVTYEDSLHRIDALELHAQDELAAEGDGS
jgi:hypothetical protein